MSGTGDTEGRGFRVTVSGGLPDEIMTRIERAVQQAVLAELADLDLGPGYRIDLAGTKGAPGQGGTRPQGIAVEAQ